MNIHSAPPEASDVPSDKRERILDAALVLFADRGYHGTAVPEVARRAGVGAGTIYRYFDIEHSRCSAVTSSSRRHLPR